ncbi:trehalose-phosphatase [Natrialbaceae archaeon GCM10025810]|uniref:trehalose-phosphatase n=1 Tax=Halovalidus salilacus TaxID=3075124 RepID=UPI0036173D01
MSDSADGFDDGVGVGDGNRHGDGVTRSAGRRDTDPSVADRGVREPEASVPDPIDEVLPSVRAALEGASRLLVCLDYDGTLAPIVEDPDEAAITPENRDAVAELTASPAVTTAVVSGRSLADVRERVAGPSAYAGNHGLELARDGSVAVHPIARTRSRRVDELCWALESVLEPIPNAWVQNKRLTGTVHFRSVPRRVRPVARRLARGLVDRFASDALDRSRGKRILEVSPSIPWGKGNAVELIEAAEPDDTFAVYVGDDVTDESAFEAVEPDGLGVRVGGAESSAASARVESPDEVASLLRWFAEVGIDRLDRSGTASPVA